MAAELTLEMIESLLNAKLTPLTNQVAKLAPLPDQVAKLAPLAGQVETLKESIEDLTDRLERVERQVTAFESLPFPFGRPKTFVSATSVHSVSQPKKRRLGYQG